MECIKKKKPQRYFKTPQAEIPKYQKIRRINSIPIIGI
jgi:hypothetical protein